MAIAFEHGDPDRPYIAHAVHDHCLADVVTRANQTRNVLRTPANNKLRMEDKPGAEHIKLSTEHGGKSQLNLGHMVGSDPSQARGEGFELRTDARGAIRAGQGLFISADAQAKAQGAMLEMDAALEQLSVSLQLVKDLAHSVAVAGASCADGQAQRGLEEALNMLQGAGLIASAPAGVAVVTPSQLQLSAGGNLIATAGDSADLSVVKRLALAAGERVSVFAQSAGMQLFAGQGDVQVHAKSASLELQAQQNIDLAAHHGEMVLHAEQGITLACRGAYITLKDGCIEIGAPGKVAVRNDNVEWGGSAGKSVSAAPLQQSETVFHQLLKGQFQIIDSATGDPKPEVPYCISAGEGAVAEGSTDAEGAPPRCTPTGRNRCRWPLSDARLPSRAADLSHSPSSFIRIRDVSDSIIRQTDSLSSGGQVLGGSTGLRFGGLPVARVGDAVSCPLPGHGLNAIAQGDPGLLDQGRAVALHGHTCQCGCTLISSLPWAVRR
ncbi:DUF2345 domain-containing protein [Pseudomonas sp. KNUC1026]|nr:DUF2345 domain-containing protein [Pseudomonas sp. KNUC1026]